MSQMSFSDFEYAGKRKQTRRERFLAEMDQVVPWAGLLVQARNPPEGHRQRQLSTQSRPLRVLLMHSVDLNARCA